ncbi:MAG TPA: GspH/FimT family protein [Cellvibrionaceae bacterium]
MRQLRGFTLIELLTALAVIAIICAIAYPAFAGILRTIRVQTATFQILEAVQLTRHHAITTNSRATIAPKDGDWQQGWEIFLDSNHNGERDTDEELLADGAALHASIDVHGNRPVSRYISYLGSGESRWATHSNGGAFQAGTISICPEEEGRGYQLVLARGGRMRKESIDEAECAAI